MAPLSFILGLSLFFTHWQSSWCSNCSGRKILNGEEGYISDGPGLYKENSHCEWLIDAGSPNKTIHLTFENMSTECSFDFLFIYDGNSYNSRLIATLSGDSPPGNISAYSGHMLLYLFSDHNYLKMGFEARYKVLDCPLNCLGRGDCVNHVCHCKAGYSGLGCEVTYCPGDCIPHGECAFQSHKLQYCNCTSGYAGHDCSLQISGVEGQGQWHTVNKGGEGRRGFTPRTSHTSVFLNGCMWVFGGFNLNTVLEDLLRFCVEENSWEVFTRNHRRFSVYGDRLAWPSARSGHAMDSYSDGFYVFGGILENGSHCNELWYFNVSSFTWRLCATESKIFPEKVTGHTLTTAEDYLYVLGGKTEERIFEDSVFRISAKNPDQWERVLVKGGTNPIKRMVGHTTVYHKHSRSLIMFGGYMQRTALFSDRTQNLYVFNVDDHYWAGVHNRDWSTVFMPRQRAFHSAVLMGNYMVVYGGNTHVHKQVEICYNQEMFFYHLGCHVWLNHTYFTGNISTNGMPTKGRFGHTAVVTNGNVMLVLGGYSGQVLSDLISYKVPSAVADFQCSPGVRSCKNDKKSADLDRDYCEDYPNDQSRTCQDDPECVYCYQGRTDRGNQSCLHRTRVELCVNGDFHDKMDRCPGICPALHTCGACVSQGRGVKLDKSWPRRRIYIKECSWCVKEAQCQTRSVPFGTCQAPDQTESRIEGWWGGLSANLTTLHQCQLEDFPAGMHWIKYKDPMNSSYPDELSIVRKTVGSLGYAATELTEREFIYTSKFLGFIHPLNASPPRGENLTLFLGLQNANAWLFLSQDETQAPDKMEKVISFKERINKYHILTANRSSGLPVFPNVARGHKYFLEQVTEQETGNGALTTEHTKINLGWNGGVKHLTRQHVITSEFLEPYSNGNCSQSYNCLACLTDVLCSWCEVMRSCVPRNTSVDLCHSGHSLQYLITYPSECPLCGNHVQCASCAKDPLCEWDVGDGHCTRRGRNKNGSVGDARECRPPCHERTNCSECIMVKNQCTWCKNTRTCLAFSDYVTRYIYGQCTSWVDHTSQGYGCSICSSHTTCLSCQREFGCGWCSNDYNPSMGLCVDGDFMGVNNRETCPELLSQAYNLSVSEPSSWSYDICPDVEECKLGLHDCHPNATCINVFGSYRCECNRGFEGDGRGRCDETCYYECKNGVCSGPPHFRCVCQLGWRGPSCAEDCGCNNHSTCNAGVGVCDECQHRTTGPTCAECMPGSYGNPLEAEGCIPCNCNGHGDLNQGECDSSTGECYCTDNTQGIHCEQCVKGYYGHSRNGGKCYLKCDHRVFLTNVTHGSLGSIQGTGTENERHMYCLWVLSVFSSLAHVPAETETVPTLSLTVEGDLEIECGQDAVQVYDGLPWFISGTEARFSQLLGSFCGIDPGRDFTVYAKSGIITVFFEADILRSKSHGFNASFRSHSCLGGCRGKEVCVDGSCVCPEGFYGDGCKGTFCEANCSEHLGRGRCKNGICFCNPGYGGIGCTEIAEVNELWLQVLSDSAMADTNSDLALAGQSFVEDTDIYGPPARAGHTMTTCGDGLVFLFGGLSPSAGVLDDMWMYNTSASTWTRIVPATDDNPGGRYHHAAACIPLLKMIFVFGGFVVQESDHGGSYQQVVTTSALWKFNIESHAWTMDSSPPWLPALAGHTLTYTGSTNLMLIGGFSASNYFNEKVFEYNVSNGLMAWQEHGPRKMKGAIPIGIYGHSAVYEPATSTIYVFGGYLYRLDEWSVSGEMYAFDVRTKEWSMLYPGPHSQWENRVFHTAAHLGEAMVVIGGLTRDSYFAVDVLVYRYACNTWHRLQFEDFHLEQSTTAALGLSAVSIEEVLYIFGGFAGLAVGTMARLHLPADLCSLVRDPLACSDMAGCQMCVLTLETGENITKCYDSHSSRHAKPAGCVGKSPKGKRCNLLNHQRRSCQMYTTCSQCMASHPHFKEPESKCIWCTDCPIVHCVPRKEGCPREHCLEPSPQSVSGCMEHICPASDCDKCGQQESCLWSRHLKRPRENARTFDPRYLDWNCVPETVRSSTSMLPERCPLRCHTYPNCHLCLNAPGGEGGSKECVWSETLQECMSPAFLPLRCSLGQCGYIYSGSYNAPPVMSFHCPYGDCSHIPSGRDSTCPQSCKVFKKCADCIHTPGCGWCAFGGMNGQGMCMSGGIDGPTEGVCSEGNFTASVPFINILGDSKKGSEMLSSHTANPMWSFDKCQPENECKNQHHTCNLDTEECIDLLENFRCECKIGYVKAASGSCEPVCHQGCVHGYCVKPDHCQCQFGWVGDNCSVECQCNKHSNCQSVLKNMICLKCENNTMGERCQHCQPMFVGNPEKGGRCIPCREFCNNHTDVCMTQHEYQLSLVDKPIPQLGQYNRYYRMLHKGPQEHEAVCINCQHNTTGDQCHRCTSGHFRQQSDAKTKTKPCQECQCNGHSNVCNENNGGNCLCKNNTNSKCDSEEQPDCYMYQCARCNEYFMGTPTNGHQCYRQMALDGDYCFDPDTQNNCNQFPNSLKMGRTVFFGVPPKYLNVDIRITIDVTMGSADVFIANKKDAFQVFVDKNTGIHDVYLDKIYASSRAGLARRSILDTYSHRMDSATVDEELQLHESGSVRITESVPDYLKWKTTDKEFYKLSQFESIDKSGSLGGSKSNSRSSNSGSSGGRGSLVEEKARSVDKGRETAKKNVMLKSLLTHKKNHRHRLRGRKHHKGLKANPQLRRKWPPYSSRNAKHFLNFLPVLEKSIENESVPRPAYRDSIDRNYNMTHWRKRYRRGLTVTDTKKESISTTTGGIKMGEIEAGDLNTYITVGQKNSILVVRDVRFRLVITLPSDQHNLRAARFFIIVRSRSGNPDNDVYGNLNFRQDQPHIDLFVFFSVFFSCFFLLLAMCVMLWKMKQTFDARRSRQMREREMECMASRPFARILVLVEAEESSLHLPLSSSLVRRRSRLSRYQHRGQPCINNDAMVITQLGCQRDLGVVPIAIEPTEDSLAAVGTVLFQLPGGATAPSRFCLGSTLTTRLPTPAPAHKSMNVRRRRSNSPC